MPPHPSAQNTRMQFSGKQDTNRISNKLDQICVVISPVQWEDREWEDQQVEGQPSSSSSKGGLSSLAPGCISYSWSENIELNIGGTQ